MILPLTKQASILFKPTKIVPEAREAIHQGHQELGGQAGPIWGRNSDPEVSPSVGQGIARSNGTLSRIGPMVLCADCCCTWEGSWGRRSAGRRTSDRFRGRTRPGCCGIGGRSDCRSGLARWVALCKGLQKIYRL